MMLMRFNSLNCFEKKEREILALSVQRSFIPLSENATLEEIATRDLEIAQDLAERQADLIIRQSNKDAQDLSDGFLPVDQTAVNLNESFHRFTTLNVDGTQWQFDQTKYNTWLGAKSFSAAQQKFIKRQNDGGAIIAMIAAVNESKTSEQVNAILQDTTMGNIERLLWNGSFVTAKALIQSLPLTIYSQNEIDLVVAEINKSLEE